VGQVIHITEMVKQLDNPPNRIREVRKAQHVTLRDIAEALGTSQTQISRFETGGRPVDLIWLGRIARVLKVDIGQLLNAEDNQLAARDERERLVLESMRRGEEIAGPVLKVAESLSSFHAEEPEEARRRA
jgi:transcriptional regulator with XRE-family HTH domain